MSSPLPLDLVPLECQLHPEILRKFGEFFCDLGQNLNFRTDEAGWAALYCAALSFAAMRPSFEGAPTWARLEEAGTAFFGDCLRKCASIEKDVNEQMARMEREKRV